MYARVTTTPISPYRLDEAIRLAEDSTMPAASKQPGFKGYLMLVDKSSGMAMTITFLAGRRRPGVHGSKYRLL